MGGTTDCREGRVLIGSNLDSSARPKANTPDSGVPSNHSRAFPPQVTPHQAQ